MPKKFDLLIFIARLQPLHSGHEETIKEALKNSDKLLILKGSSNVPSSLKNPWTYDECVGFIKGSFPEAFPIDESHAKIIIRPLNDYLYNDTMWLSKVQSIVQDVILTSKITPNKIGVVGFAEGHISYDMNIFKPLDWEIMPIPQYSIFSASSIRSDYFRDSPRLPHGNVSDKVYEYLKKFMLTNRFADLVREANFYKSYREKYGLGPYITSDNVVIQNNHILLIERGELPGKGLLAFPGGFLEENETFIDAAVRELREETQISDGKSRKGIPSSMLKRYITKNEIFDHPERDPRARIVTNAFLYELPPNGGNMYQIEGGDDAAAAAWYPVGTLKCNQMFGDHYFIMCKMLGLTME